MTLGWGELIGYATNNNLGSDNGPVHNGLHVHSHDLRCLKRHIGHVLKLLFRLKYTLFHIFRNCVVFIIMSLIF